MKYRIKHVTTYAYSAAAPVCHNQVHLAPRDSARQTRHDFRLSIQPEPSSRFHHQDFFGNDVTGFEINQAHRRMSITSTSRIELSPPAALPETSAAWEEIAHRVRTDRSPECLSAYQFCFASPLIRPSASLADYARDSFPSGRPIIEAMRELTRRIHEDFEYDPTATTTGTPLAEAFQLRRGVCQDFAHVQIGCLRSLGLPARYVSGYLRTIPPEGKPALVGADASHAWLSIFCGDAGWIDADPTNDVIPQTDHITVAFGRDYDDVCPVQGIVVGGGAHTMSVSVDVAVID